MKILLIRPKPHKETIGLQHVMICEPLELEYIAANIEDKEASVEIIDMILEKKPLEYFIQKHQPNIVGLSGYITHVEVIKGYGERIKKIKPDTTVVVGGVHAEVVPQDFVSDFIDYIVEANPIKTFNQIINHPGEKDIQGTYQPGKTNVKETTFSYKFPARNKVAKYRNQYYYMFHNPCSLIKTSFGCPYNCSFCFCKEITDGKYYTRSIDSVIQELKGIPEQEIYIVDDDFLFSSQRILEFCQRLQEENIHKRFLVYGRADFIYKNESVMKTFKEAGLRAVIVGLESFKKADLDKYNKGTNIIENEEAVKILKRHDIEIYGTFILDMDFSKEDFKDLYGWIKKLDLTFVNLQPLTPLPGTEIYESYEKHFIIQKQEYEKWDLAHLVLAPTKMSVRRYYFEMIKLYYKITMDPKSVVKLIRKYGFKDVLKLSIGSSRVTQQYIGKIVRGK
ncbi:Radical SAM domain protein [Alkaliphilus metalliredigens QYMF]|uniref:Radical SAM domain protein n=1 Tax=Alkaliphilus metalliredigens (strain QYMF) TaxID=293826 RepID=A6TTU5_ALKMQ|nr:B12-binding domain-containing radical SAM protein [Alkaliphilus metalliredigens]ABR49613.1 Radical SAM domain protein [Alkaliphilus metalliredigens QYMF]